jgi:XRE family transcriptional regulator, regulator of sulfur utilization
VSAIATENGAVGERVKALRRSMGLSLRELAERAGVSAPMLSQVERGDTSPTLTVAGKIATGLELTLSQLLRLDEGQHVVVVPQGSGRSRERGGHRTEELTPALPGQRADVSRHTLEPGASTGGPQDPPMHEAGARETALVLGGTLTLMVDSEAHTLQAGDAVTFDADLPHHFENRDASKCEFVAVVAAGLRRS